MGITHIHYNRHGGYNVCDMSRGFSKSENLTKNTLLAIAAIGIVFVAPGMAPLLRGLARNQFGDKSKAAVAARARRLRELQKRKLIKFTELGGGGVEIELTHLGKKIVRIYDLDKIRLVKPKDWDGKWRVLMYDIPKSKKKASDAFRGKIKQLGLFPLQKSVWVSAYDCFSELEFLATVFDLALDKHIHYFTTKEIPRESEIKDFFEI